MLGSNSVRFQVVVGLALSCATAAGFLACASASSPASDEDAGAARVTDVRVESSAGASTITIVGPEAPVFTAFQQEDPDRVIVDLANVDATDVEGTTPVFDGIVDSIRVEPVSEGDEGQEAQDGQLTRIEVLLASPAEYEVRSGVGALIVELTALGASAGGDANGEGSSEAEDPWAVYPEDEEPMGAAAWENGEDGAAEPWVAGEQAPAVAATILDGVEARAVGEGSIVQLKGNGSVENVVTFTLENPARLVVDLPGVKSEMSTPRIEVGTPQVSRVRVGEHADKLRVVIDAGDGVDPFEGRRVVPVPTGLVIALGSDPELEEAVALVSGSGAAVLAGESEPGAAAEGAADDSAQLADAEVPEGESADGMTFGEQADAPAGDALAETDGPSDGKVMIYGVQLEPQADRDRVVVLGEEPIENYLVYEPDSGTVVLSITGAVISPEASARIAPTEPGAVSLVTAFEQPDVPRPEVRVVVKRAPDLKPQISRRDSLLILDFPRTGGIAATPPVYDTNLAGQPTAPEAFPAGEALPDAMGTDLASVPQMAPAAETSVPFPASAEPAPGLDVPMPELPAEPAAGEPPAAIEILKEGGLLDGKEYVGRRISLDFKDVDVADVLRLIAEVSNLNVIAGDEVKGSVTIRLVDIPWDQALDVVLLTKGLGFVRIGNVLRVASSSVLAQEEEIRLQERRAKEKLEDLVVKLQPVNYADVSDVSQMVKELLTPRGSVNTDTRTNTLIIKDIASVIDEATALVKAVDTMTPQVMIEAKIVEANLDFSRELGTRWTFGTNPATEATLGGRDYIFTPGADDDIAEGLGNQVVFGNPITAGPTGTLALAATVLDSKFNYEVELQAAEVSGDGKVISSPRVVTLDNSTAKIEQGVSIPFQTFENGDAALEFVDAVLSLDVTPHITSDKSIIMEVKVSRNAPDDSVFTLTGSPAIAKNQVETETLVKDGQTLVLGGIYVVDRSERQSRVPFLNRIPFLGILFKSDEFSDSRKELLVFVSPRIVQTPGAEAAL